MSEEEKTKADVEASTYRFLARRDHARGELEAKLLRRQFSGELIKEVLDACEEAGYLDDERFAREQGAILVRKCWGPHQITRKLKARGVKEAIIEQALSDINAREYYEQRAQERLLARFGKAAELDDSQRRRAFRHLSYRGYPAALIRGLLFDY